MMPKPKVYYPETVENYPLGIYQEPDSKATSVSTKSALAQGGLSPVDFPTSLIAQEVLSRTLDTQRKRILGEYNFGVSGALQMGVYENTVTGDIKLSPTGILGRNKTGATTFAIDAVTGDATFGGTLTANVVVAAGALVVGTNVDIGTAQDSAGVTTIVGNTVTTGYITALSMVVGTEIGLGTAQDAAGVTTIVGNTVTTGFVNALSVVAGSVTAENVTAGTLTGHTVRTKASGVRVQMNANEAWIGFYDSGDDVVGFIDDASGEFRIASADGRSLDLYGDQGTGPIVFHGTQIDCNSIDLANVAGIDMENRIDMNGHDIDEIDTLSFDARSTDVGDNWAIYAYSNGGTHQLRVRLNGTTYWADLSN